MQGHCDDHCRKTEKVEDANLMTAISCLDLESTKHEEVVRGFTNYAVTQIGQK